MFSILKKPAVQNVTADKKLVSFTLQWDSNAGACKFFNVGGAPYAAQQYSLQLGAMGVSSLGSPRAIKIQQSFASPTGAGDVDGDLFIEVPSTGEVTRLSYPLTQTTGPTENFLVLTPQVSAVFPVEATQGATINFTKLCQAAVGVQPPIGAAICHGILFCTVYDFDVNPFSHSGFSYTL